MRLVGAPLVLVALGLLWWAWWSARALRRGRREGWTLLLVLGGVAVMQAVLTAQAVLASSGAAAPGTRPARGRRREVAAGLLAAIGLGLVSLTVALLARRAWAAADAAAATRTADRGLDDRRAPTDGPEPGARPTPVAPVSEVRRPRSPARG